MIRMSGRTVIKSTLLMTSVLLIPAVLVARQKRPPTYRIPMPPKPDFSSIEWMVGDWTGQMVKHSPQGEIRLSVSYDLDRRVMVFREEISLAATSDVPASNESSIGILSQGRSGDSLLFQLYSSTGFISRYRVNVAGSEIDFTPDGGAQPLPGWLSRRIIQRSDIDEFTETVQLAPPQKPFFDYYTVAFSRQATSSKSTAGGSAGHKKP